MTDSWWPSCYFSPSRLIEEFNAYLTELEGSTSTRGKVVVAGYFNAKSEEWFASCTDRKGALQSEFATANRLVVMNDSADPTRFSRLRIPHRCDLCLQKPSLPDQGLGGTRRGIRERPNYICFTVERRTIATAAKKAGRWAINKLDTDQLEVVILASEWDKDLVLKGISMEAAAQKSAHRVTAACDVTIPQQRP